MMRKFNIFFGEHDILEIHHSCLFLPVIETITWARTAK